MTKPLVPTPDPPLTRLRLAVSRLADQQAMPDAATDQEVFDALAEVDARDQQRNIRFTGLREEVVGLRDELAAVQQERDYIRKEANAQFDVDGKNQRILVQECDDLRATVARLEAEQGALRTERDALQEQNDKLRAQVLMSERHRLEDAADHCDGQLLSKETIDSLRAQVADFQRAALPASSQGAT